MEQRGRKNLFFSKDIKLKNTNLIISKGFQQFLYSGKRKILDFSLSSGALILGHSNKIFKKSILQQINKGSNYSNTNSNEFNYKIELKKTFKEFDKIIFSNSGSEANIRALRIARSVTKKQKYAMVNGSWHGSVDNFMFDFVKNKNSNQSKIHSLSSGIDHIKKDVILIPYNNIKVTKKILDKNCKIISMLIIEPIQCGIPNAESFKYLNFLNKYCKRKKILLCFDEVITGLRTKKFAIYKQLNIKPDIVTFAKCFGGGLPIGITLYNSKITNKIILKKKIFFGGTFSGNPLSCRVGLNTFLYIKKNKTKIDFHTNQLAFKLESEINNFCLKKNLNFRLQRFENILRPIFTYGILNNRIYREIYDPKFKNSLYLKEYLEKNNIFISSNCCFFVSYCHTNKDINNLILILKKFLLKFFFNK